MTSRILRAARLTEAELAATSACAFTFIFWNASARNALTLDVVWFFALFCFACLLAGRVFCAGVLGRDDACDFPTIFLFGFLGLNSALFLLAWVSPLPIAANALLLLVAVLAAQLRWPTPRPAEEDGRRTAGPGLLTLALCLIAATFWSGDAITAEVVLREGVLVKPWIDSHYHASLIQMFHDARGVATFDNYGLSGGPLRVYHYASYLVPALLTSLTSTSPYQAYGSFQVPAGVVLAGLAAHALVRSLWGGEAGVAAAAALLLLPDASRHGLPNALLSYHWLQQIAPAGLYGVAALAAAWLLMFAGCRTGRLALVALAFLAAGMGLHFKSHVFVASALLIWLYPGACLRGVPWRWKVAWLAFALTVFVALVRLSQRFESVPTLTLDGSSIKTYMNATVARLYYGRHREYFSRFTPTSSLLSDVWWGSILLSYATLGLFGVAGVVLALVVLARRVLRAPARGVALEHAVFPILIMVNYLVMSLGLPLDRRNGAHPEELLHRPLVWAYFVAAACAGGLAYRLVLEGPVRGSPRLRGALIAGALALLTVPHALGPGIQVGPEWGRILTCQFYPRGLFECARYLRENADPGELVQDSKNDPHYVLCAASGHPAYVIGRKDAALGPMHRGRLDEVEDFQAMDGAEAIRRFAQLRRIRWYVLWPDTRVEWPEALLAKAVFSWNGFRVLGFEPPPRGRHLATPEAGIRTATAASSRPR